MQTIAILESNPESLSQINTYLESRNSRRIIKILGEIVTIYIKYRASLGSESKNTALRLLLDHNQSVAAEHSISFNSAQLEHLLSAALQAATAVEGVSPKMRPS